MAKFGDLEKILTAARQVGEGIQRELDKATSENEKLQKVNVDLQAEIKTLREENETLRANIDDVNSAKDTLREANETLENNLNEMMVKLNATIEDSHKAFMSQINQFVHDEFQKVFAEYFDKIRSTTETRVAKVEEIQPATQDESRTVVVENIGDNLPDANLSPKSRMMYADFYAVENVGDDAAETHNMDFQPAVTRIKNDD